MSGLEGSAMFRAVGALPVLTQRGRDKAVGTYVISS
jgi:hypothetical protein